MENLTDDVAACSAALVWNSLPEIAKLPSVEGFERLKAHFEAALTAYRDGLKGWFEPSKN